MSQAAGGSLPPWERLAPVGQREGPPEGGSSGWEQQNWVNSVDPGNWEIITF